MGGRDTLRSPRVKELGLPDLDLIKQAEQGCRDANGRFRKGRVGQPQREVDGGAQQGDGSRKDQLFERRLREMDV
jgi:hypothetical protein